MRHMRLWSRWPQASNWLASSSGQLFTELSFCVRASTRCWHCLTTSSDASRTCTSSVSSFKGDTAFGRGPSATTSVDAIWNPRLISRSSNCRAWCAVPYDCRQPIWYWCSVCRARSSSAWRSEMWRVASGGVRAPRLGSFGDSGARHGGDAVPRAEGGEEWLPWSGLRGWPQGSGIGTMGLEPVVLRASDSPSAASSCCFRASTSPQVSLGVEPGRGGAPWAVTFGCAGGPLAVCWSLMGPRRFGSWSTADSSRPTMFEQPCTDGASAKPAWTRRLYRR
mmetsp:Transcript_72228/g.127258  ORF Transcript_72228/g.127258 Transcript_72228/m.127258 type:complete len:279 (+) Transcript_72228:514-1350(+)